MFNKPTEWTYNDWLRSDAKRLLNQIPRNVGEWVSSLDMTDDEKMAYPTHETTGGYLKILDESKRGQLWWDGLSDSNKKVIKSMPNFDSVLFEEITGVKVGS
jgi:Ulp1 family protease